ncbi:MAG: baseplate J/gp47 family protein [Chloroflexi bacterium]|nr:baseplate J/gp47 family protein [Chloroflexota bacterium]
MSFQRRSFPEVLDNILTAIVGGVAAEAHPFPPPATAAASYRHNLQQPPAADVVSVYGSRNGEPHLFRKGTDYKLSSDRQAIEWQKGADLPDAGSVLHINYTVPAAQAPLTDLHVGSVVRTLAESVALEIAGLYAQLEAVYDAGFVDTASAKALDNVVALLGVTRVQGGRAAGELEFSRSPGSRGVVTIPAGTRVITPDGNVEYETVESVTMAEGRNTIRVVARDLEPNDPLAADSLTVLPVPIAGISSVTNPAPTAISAQDETDAQLRTRAKNFLHGSERATLGAIQQAIVRQGITADVEEVKDASGRIQEVAITPHAETLPPELLQRLKTAINDARPAGVLVNLKGVEAPRKVNLGLRLTTRSGLLEQDLRAVQRAIRSKIEDYFARLPAREAGSINRLVGLVLSVPEVEDVRLLSASLTPDGATGPLLDADAGLINIAGFPTVLGDLQIVDPNLPTLLNAVVTYQVGEAPPDQPAILASLTSTVTYLNSANSSESVPAAVQAVSYGKLLRVVPLPGKAAASLEEHDKAVAGGGTVPPLPNEAGVAPYQVQFVFVQESGLSRILSKASDQPYTLVAFERLSTASVQVQEESGSA